MPSVDGPSSKLALDSRSRQMPASGLTMALPATSMQSSFHLPPLPHNCAHATVWPWVTSSFDRRHISSSPRNIAEYGLGPSVGQAVQRIFLPFLQDINSRS